VELPKLKTAGLLGVTYVAYLKVEALETVRSLQITRATCEAFEFPKLVNALDQIGIVRNVNIKSISFPVLVKVKTYLQFLASLDLTSVHLPELTQVGTQLAVWDYSYLSNLYVPKLRSVPGLTISGLKLMEQPQGKREGVVLSLPALTNLTSFELSNDQGFAAVSAPLLKSIGYINFKLNSVTELDFPLLSTASLTGVNMYRNSLLTKLTMPALVTLGAFSLSYSDELSSLEFPLLKTAKSIAVSDCFGMKALKLPELTNAGTVDIKTNIALATIDLPKLRTTTHMYIRDLVTVGGVPGCVNMDCLNFDERSKPSFQVYWCRTFNFTAPSCSAGVHWSCTCKSF